VSAAGDLEQTTQVREQNMIPSKQTWQLRPVAIAIAACMTIAAPGVGAQSAPSDDAERARAEQQRQREDEARLREEEDRPRGEQARTTDDEVRMREAEARLRAAEARLAEAASEIAELNRAMAPRAARLAERIEITSSDTPRLGIGLGREVTSDGDGERRDEVRVMSVSPGSPADEAGVLASDRLTSIDGQSLQSNELDDALAIIKRVLKSKKKGDDVELGILRDGEPLTLTVPLGGNAFGPNVFAFEFDGVPMAEGMESLRERLEVLHDDDGTYAYSMMFGALQSPLADMELVELTPELGEYFGADSGLLVVRAPENEAFELRDGDVIRSIGGREPDSVRHAMRILRSYKAGETMPLEIIRRQRRRTLSIEVPEPERPEPVIVPGGWMMAPGAPTPAPAVPSWTPAPAAPAAPPATGTI
jgi:hypothetical protein